VYQEVKLTRNHQFHKNLAHVLTIWCVGAQISAHQEIEIKLHSHGFFFFFFFPLSSSTETKRRQVPSLPARPKVVSLIVVYLGVFVFFPHNISNSLSNCSFLFLFASMSSSCTRKVFWLIAKEF